MSFYRKRNKTQQMVNKLREKVEKNEAFNKIPKYYINLDRSIDRKLSLEKEIKRYQIENIYRFKSVEGKKITDLKQGKIDGVQFDNEYSNYKDKIGLAITLSHLECVRYAGEKNKFPFIILEDDVRFTLMPHWKKNIDEIILDLPNDCDILNLVYANDGCLEGEFLLDNYTTALAYVVTKKGYNSIMNIFYEDNKWVFRKKLKLNNCYIDQGIRSKLITYHYNPVLFLLDGESQKNSTYDGKRNYSKFIKIDLQKYPIK